MIHNRGQCPERATHTDPVYGAGGAAMFVGQAGLYPNSVRFGEIYIDDIEYKFHK